MVAKCPRCPLRVKNVRDQIEKCAFCRERHRRVCDNEPRLVSPTSEFPTGRKHA